MKKKLITFYGNSNHVIDIASLFAVSCAKNNINALLIELGEGSNPRLAYKLGLEDQRIKTTDYYLQNIKKNIHLDACVLKKDDICEILTDREKSLAGLIKKLPDKLKILPRKAPADEPALTEEEYKNAIEIIRKEGFENNDIIAFALSGNCYSYPVFFSHLYSDVPVIITEDTPEDIRGLNRLVVDMKKITGFDPVSIYLDYGSEISIDNFEKTALSVEYVMPLKSIFKMRVLSSKAFEGDIPEEIESMVSKIALGTESESKKSIFSMFTKKNKEKKERKPKASRKKSKKDNIDAKEEGKEV